MNTETKEKVDNILNKEYLYKGKKIKIDRYKDVSGVNIVFFQEDRVVKNILTTELDEFIGQLFEPTEKELSPTQIAVPENKIVVFQPTAESKEVKETLMDTLKKLKENKDYIPQAEAICQVVSQIVNVQKTEIQMLQLLNKGN